MTKEYKAINEYLGINILIYFMNQITLLKESLNINNKFLIIFIDFLF